MPRHLSKSKLMAFRQCPKRLWLQIHKPELETYSSEAQAAFAQGHAVGEVARGLWPGGQLVGHDQDLATAIKESQAWLDAGMPHPLFEGTFAHGGVLVRADVLEPKSAGVRLVEVKSAASVKPHYPDDCAIQAWVLRGAGLPVTSVELAHVDNQFVYPGGGDYQGLLKHVDLTEEVAPICADVGNWAEDATRVVAGAEPEVVPGPQCGSPYTCPFNDLCNPPIADYPVTLLPGPGKSKKAAELLALGYKDIRDVPPGLTGKPHWELIRDVTLRGAVHIAPEAADYFRTLPYPRFHIDFETIGPALPIWAGTRPFRPIPFQWSCHIERGPGQLEHAEFLDTTGENPHHACIEKLLEVLADAGPVFSYHHYEKTILNAAAVALPDLAPRINAVIDRLVDLLPLTRQWYYHPALKGLFSIKVVAPTVDRLLDYSVLGDVQDGYGASDGYLEMIHPDTSPERRAELKAALLRYCAQDTLAMVKIAEMLERGSTQGDTT